MYTAGELLSMDPWQMTLEQSEEYARALTGAFNAKFVCKYLRLQMWTTSRIRMLERMSKEQRQHWMGYENNLPPL